MKDCIAVIKYKPIIRRGAFRVERKTPSRLHSFSDSVHNGLDMRLAGCATYYKAVRNERQSAEVIRSDINGFMFRRERSNPQRVRKRIGRGRARSLGVSCQCRMQLLVFRLQQLQQRVHLDRSSTCQETVEDVIH